MHKVVDNLTLKLLTKTGEKGKIFLTLNERRKTGLYEKIKALMKERGVRQRQLTKDTGIAKQSLSQWRLGLCKPSAKSLRKLADYFSVSVDYFLERG